MFTPRGASPVVLKVLNSAIANAEHNNGANVEKLYVKEAYVNEGVRLKRMMPRAKGQGDLIQKRTSHITVVVAERE
jgi:large subunit ribosomal protein L22